MGVTNFDIIQANQYLGLPEDSSGADQNNTGKVFYVNNSTANLLEGSVGGSNGNSGTSPLEPFATLDYAIGRCAANRGDTIYVMPGHAETLSAAGAIAADVAGIEIIGVGDGADRPEFTFDTATTASMTVSANNISIKNIVGIAGIDGLTEPFNVTGNGCKLDIEWQDGSATVEAATAVRLDTANNCILKLRYLGFTAGNALVAAVRLDDCDNVRIFIDAYGIVSTAWVEMVDVASIDVVVQGYMFTSGVTNGSRDIVDTITGSTWYGEVYDGSAGSKFSGGSAAAWAADDVGTVVADITAIQADIGNPSARTNLQSLEAMLGNPDTASQSIWNALVGTSALFSARLGQKVTRAAADIFDGTAAKGLFAVSGGRVLLTHFECEVTVAAIDAGASNMNFVSNPTVGTDMDLAAVLDINADELGTIYSISGIISDAVTGGSGGGAMAMQRPIVIPEGQIAITTAADVGTGGALGQCELWFIPLDVGATVAAV